MLRRAGPAVVFADVRCSPALSACRQVLLWVLASTRRRDSAGSPRSVGHGGDASSSTASPQREFLPPSLTDRSERRCTITQRGDGCRDSRRVSIGDHTSSSSAVRISRRKHLDCGFHPAPMGSEDPSFAGTSHPEQTLGKGLARTGRRVQIDGRIDS